MTPRRTKHNTTNNISIQKCTTRTILKNVCSHRRRLIPILAASYLLFLLLLTSQLDQHQQQQYQQVLPPLLVGTDKKNANNKNHHHGHQLRYASTHFNNNKTTVFDTLSSETTTRKMKHQKIIEEDELSDSSITNKKISNNKKKQQQEKQQQQETKTLALLYPPGMIGGYRNQVLRFVGFISYAKQHNMTQLLVPSIFWSTQYKNQISTSTKSSLFNEFFPIPMEWIFDIHHWNTFSPNYLPKLVYSMTNQNDKDHDEEDDEDKDKDEGVCWKTQQNNINNLENDYYYRLVSNTTQSSTSGGSSSSSSRTTTTSTTANFISPVAQILMETTPFLTPLINTTRAVLAGQLKLNPRKIDFYPDVEHCQYPYVYGGGKGAGRLWNDYLILPKEIPGINTTKDVIQAKETTNLIQWISRALQPSKRWQKVAKQCIQTSQEYHLGHKITSLHSYIALHARVEIDMMIHKCGKEMEKNLTTIFDMVEQYRIDYNNKQQPSSSLSSSSSSLDGVFVAVSRSGMQQPPNNDLRIQQLAKENWQTLMKRSSSTSLLLLGDDDVVMMNGTNNITAGSAAGPEVTTSERHRQHLASSQRKLDVSSSKSSSSDSSLFFECGELWMNRWYKNHQPMGTTTTDDKNKDHNYGDDDDDDDKELRVPDDYYGSLVPSMMNFFLATQAKVFIGVAKSSWSTDVWTTRYYQGKGDTNFEYTSMGIIRPIANGGLPPPHKNC